MTRQYTRSPAWNQSDLPTPDETRIQGWFIAEIWGDKCPKCRLKEVK